MPMIHAGVRQLLGPYHSNCEGPIVMRELWPGSHIRMLRPLDIMISLPLKAENMLTQKTTLTEMCRGFLKPDDIFCDITK
jgi:hypothetical protein